MYILKHPSDESKGYVPEVTEQGYWTLSKVLQDKYVRKPTGTTKAGATSGGK